MTLASDILRRAAVSPEQYKPSPVVAVKQKPAVIPISNRGLHMARAPGCYRVENGWRAKAWDGVMEHNLGTFDTLTRARIAWRLWQFWRQQGYDLTPTR